MKKILSISAIFMALMISCTKVDEAGNNSNPLPMPEKAEVSVQGMDITPKNSYVVVGEAVQLEVAFSPADALVSGNMTWTSSNTAVATVDASGAVTTLGVGIARITAAVDGASATAIVNVFAERIPATEIKLNKAEITLLAGRATQVKATLLPDGTGEDGVATTDKLNLEWSSSDESVAIVSYGYIQAKGMGEAIITAKQGDLTATVKVTVADKIQLQDRSEAWPIADKPVWDKNWSGQITGSHEEVSVSGVDAAYNYMAVMDADKFPGIEALANSVYEQVEEKKDAGQDPASLFGKGETRSMNYSDLGNAIAIVLGYDEEFEFTGEYSQYAFEARTPDPVHATGIQFTQGWYDTPITKIELKEGKSLSPFSAKLLPDDCTDTGEISFKSSDESVVKISVYYSNYYTVTAVSEGEADIVATFNDIKESIHVTVTGSNITLKDRTADWKITTRVEEEEWYGTIYKSYYATVTVCDATGIYAFGDNEMPTNLKSYLASKTDGVYSWSIKSSVPAEFSFYDEVKYVFVVGMDASGAWTGEYGVYTFGGEEPGGGDEPGGGEEPVEPVDGKRIKFGDVVFRAELPESRATSDEGTLEAWIYVTSTNGCQNIMGSEANFLLRIDSNQLDYVYGGEIDNRGEVGESHVRASISTNEWHHVVATYTQNDEAILYVDGEKVGSGNTLDHPVYMDGKTKNDGTYPCWGYPFRFHFGSGSDKHNYSGSIAYARVYDRAISASEIADLMYEEDVEDDALIGYWKFNEGNGNQITDYSGNSLTLSAKKALTGNASGTAPNLEDATITWEDGTLPF